MNSKQSEAQKTTLPVETENSAEQVIKSVYCALKDKGHDATMQFVGYLLSGDPTYITSYNGARSIIRSIERDEILEELVKSYVKSFTCKDD